MTNKEFLNRLPLEKRTHASLMKFYNCLDDLTTWNTWLGQKYNPNDPAWIHTRPGCCKGNEVTGGHRICKGKEATK